MEHDIRTLQTWSAICTICNSCTKVIDCTLNVIEQTSINICTLVILRSHVLVALQCICIRYIIEHIHQFTEFNNHQSSCYSIITWVTSFNGLVLDSNQIGHTSITVIPESIYILWHDLTSQEGISTTYFTRLSQMLCQVMDRRRVDSFVSLFFLSISQKHIRSNQILCCIIWILVNVQPVSTAGQHDTTQCKSIYYLFHISHVFCLE